MLRGQDRVLVVVASREATVAGAERRAPQHSAVHDDSHGAIACAGVSATLSSTVLLTSPELLPYGLVRAGGTDHNLWGIGVE